MHHVAFQALVPDVSMGDDDVSMQMNNQSVAIWKGCAGVALALGLWLAAPQWAAGQGEANLATSNYFQNFDSLGTNDVAALPPGFKMTPSNILSVQKAVWANTSNFVSTVIAASGGAPTNGGRYNWGAADSIDRAPGFMTSTRFLGNNGILAGFTNNTGDTIAQIAVRFSWEQYRANAEGATNLCYFSQTGTSAGWGEPLSSNVFPAAAGAYGYPLATTAISVVKSGLAITNGGKFYLLFYFTQAGLKGAGWALDDLELTLQFPEITCTAGAVEYLQQLRNYVEFATGGTLFDNGPEELGMSAIGADQRIAAWRDFRTDGDGNGDARQLQPGDRFRIGVSGWASNGVLGCALTDGPVPDSWDARTNNARGYFEWNPARDGLAVVSQAGESGWSGVYPWETNVTLEFTVLSSREFTASVVGGAAHCDLPMLNDPGEDARIDGFVIYGASGTDEDEAFNALWTQETSVTNLGFVEFGADGGTRTIFGKITDGNSPACPARRSPNRLVKSGAGTVTLANSNNTYSLDTEIAAGTLQIAADTCLGTPPIAVSNAHLKLAGGALLEFTEDVDLHANRGLALGAGLCTLAVATGKTVSYAGAIGGPGELRKSGGGALVLAGTNTHGGATTIAEGTLRMMGSATDSAFEVLSGATLTGTGQVGDLAVGGLVDPGDSVGARASLSCAALSLLPGGTLCVDIAHAVGVPGTDWDRLSAAGAIGANASDTFTIRLRGSPADFDPALAYRWPIMQGTSVADFSASRFAVDLDDFLPETAGGTFRVAEGAGELAVEFVPAAPPDPFRQWLQESQGLDPDDPRYAPDADDDQDGMTTSEEFAADTNPALSGSVLRVTGTYSQVERHLLLEFPASSNRFYQLVYSTNLGQGYASSNLGPGIPGMVVTNEGFESWFGGVRALMTNPVAP